MNKPTDHLLKIADTPTDDDQLSPPAGGEGVGAADSAPKPQPKTQVTRRSAQRLTPTEMDLEIDRVRLCNGRPTLARDTCSD